MNPFSRYIQLNSQCMDCMAWLTNTLRLRQNGHHLAEDIFKCIFMNENARISIKISPKFVPKDPINNIAASVQIMAWRQPGNKPLSEPMMVSLLMHICVTRPQWVNKILQKSRGSFIHSLTQCSWNWFDDWQTLSDNCLTLYTFLCKICETQCQFMIIFDFCQMLYTFSKHCKHQINFTVN